MIKKLNAYDDENVKELIKDEPEFNLYITGDIENFGYDKDFLEFFGEFDDRGGLTAILVRFFDIFNLYAKQHFDVDGFLKIIKNYKSVRMLVGKTDIVSKFDSAAVGLNKLELHHFAVLREINDKFKVDGKITVKKAAIGDIDRIADLKNSIAEFSSGSSKFKEILLNDFKNGSAHGYYIEAEGRMVSYAQTSAENSVSAMVVSVMTDEKYRKMGLASACVKVLCTDLVKQGKTLCLFYKNPKAGAIYRKIGFMEIGLWSMYMV